MAAIILSSNGRTFQVGEVQLFVMMEKTIVCPSEVVGSMYPL